MQIAVGGLEGAVLSAWLANRSSPPVCQLLLQVPAVAWDLEAGLHVGETVELLKGVGFEVEECITVAGGETSQCTLFHPSHCE